MADPAHALRSVCAEEPIFVGGCGRSGTTLLVAVLGAHPDIFVIPGETRVFCPYAYLQADADVTLVAPESYAGEGYRRLVDGLLATYAEKASAVVEAIRASGRTRWCEKTPKNVLFFDAIRRYFDGRVRMIHLVRDGRDVITSRHPLDPGASWISPERWIADVEAGIRHEHLAEVLTVRYEDLVLEFDATIRRILAFLAVEYHPYLDQWHLHTPVQESGAWRGGSVRALSPDSIGRHRRPDLAPVVGDLVARPRARALLERYGYL